jgi:ATP-dependent protease ClpP protease subunit
MYGLRQQTNDWYRIKNQVDGPTQLHIYDEIGYFGVSAGDLIRDLADVNGPIEVHVNSPGGEVFDGIAIYNALMARKDVTVVIDGLAASIASVIAMAGNPVLMARNSQMMIHDGFAMAIGNAGDMREMAELLDKTSNNIASIYSDHTGRPVSYWREIMRAETWYDSDEAIDAGLADRLVDSGAGRRVPERPEDKWDLGVYRGDHAKPHQASTYMPWDPDGDGDDDSTPQGDLDNSHWAKDGTQLRDVPGRPLSNGALIDIRSSSVDYSPWDAGRAMHDAAIAENSATYYNGICAGRREGDPAKQGSHALPHHYHPDVAPNAAGVRAALDRLNQTSGLANTDAARSHLEAHMRAIDPDWTPGGKSPASKDSAGDPFGLEDADWIRLASELRGARK